MFRLLEEESYWYAIRLKANAVPARHIVHPMKRPVGRPSKKPKVFYHSSRYQAKSWDRARRVAAKIKWHAGELFPRVGFVVTNLRRGPKRVIRFYNGMVTAEQWIKEGKNAVKWTRLSCLRFKDNQVRLHLFENFLRQLASPREVKHWSLTTLQIPPPRRGIPAQSVAKVPGSPRWDAGKSAPFLFGTPSANLGRRPHFSSIGPNGERTRSSSRDHRPQPPGLPIVRNPSDV